MPPRFRPLGPIFAAAIALGAPYGRHAAAAPVEAVPTVATVAAPQGRPQEHHGGALRDRIDEVLRFTQRERRMSLQDNAAWQILHGVLAYGRDFEMYDGDQPVKVLDWLFAGKPMKGWTIRPTQYGLQAEIEPGRFGQGHDDQWLAILAQAGVPYDQKLSVGGEEYEIYDLIRNSMYHCYEGKEASWTVIELSYYLDPLDQKWQAMDGDMWTVGRLAAMEAGPNYDPEQWQERIWGGACGGTHRLIGLAISLNNWKRAYPGKKLPADWQAVEDRVSWAIDTAREYQLPSGAFSIMFFMRPSNSRSIDEHLAATGHTLEFLSFALTREQLKKPWVENAANYLCDLLERTRELDLECGALYHAAHGLVLYRENVWGERGDW